MINYSAAFKTKIDVITLAQAKDHLGITHDHQNDLIQSFIDAAVIHAENYTGRSVNIYDVTIKSTGFGDSIPLVNAPILDAAAIAIKYYNSDNSEITLDPSFYDVLEVNGEPEIFYKPDKSLPSVFNRNDAVNITYQSGYAAADKVPDPFGIFVKLTVSFLYDNRGDTVDKLPRFTNSILRRYKKWV